MQNYLSGDDQAASINRLDNFFGNESNPSWYLPLAGDNMSKMDTHQIC